MKKCITDFDLSGKKVIIRVDFNVPIRNGLIEDDNRIIKSLKTIEYAYTNGAKVILLAHLGRVKEEKDKALNSLKVVSQRLSELLKKDVLFVDQTRGEKVKTIVDNMKDGDIVLLENTRYEDYPDKLESSNDENLSKEWASLGDIFINDAFGLIHRAHASNAGIAKFLPNGIGLLVKEEMDAFDKLKNPAKPFIVILGGAKVSDKIGVIDNLIKKADYILIGGGMSYTFLKSLGYNVGKSILDTEHLDYAKDLLAKNSNIILPVDTVTSTSLESAEYKVKDISSIEDDEIGLDIGPKTSELFASYLKDAKTVVWNGPMGVFENPLYSVGTNKMLEELKNVPLVIIGGGDTASAAINAGYSDDFELISTGGGASLEVLAGNELPGLEVIDEK